jgi:hypothetical protein
MAKWLMILGALLFLIGTVLYCAPWLFSWFGKLPGDIDYRSERTRIFFPITSMLLISIALSLLLSLFKR